MAEKKYKPRFAKELLDGMRKDGMSIEECCVHWGISRALWYVWVKKYDKFAQAAEFAETQYRAWFQGAYRAGMTGQVRMNAGMMKFAAANILEWRDKAETSVVHQDQVHTLNINVLPTYQERMALESYNDVIEGVLVESTQEEGDDK